MPGTRSSPRRGARTSPADALPGRGRAPLVVSAPGKLPALRAGRLRRRARPRACARSSPASWSPRGRWSGSGKESWSAATPWAPRSNSGGPSSTRPGLSGSSWPILPALPSALSVGLDRPRHDRRRGPRRRSRKSSQLWDEGARAAIQKSAPAGSGTHQGQLAMLAVICEHIRAWRSAEKELARAQRALDLADRLYDAYQERQKRQLEEMLTGISRRVAEIYGQLHPGEELSRDHRGALDREGARARRRFPRLEAAAAPRGPERIAPQLPGHRAFPGHGPDLQPEAPVPGPRRRHQQLRPGASRRAGGAPGREVRRLAARGAHPRPPVLRSPRPPRALVEEARDHVLELRTRPADDQLPLERESSGRPRSAWRRGTSAAPPPRPGAPWKSSCRRSARRSRRRSRSGGEPGTTSGRSAS